MARSAGARSALFVAVAVLRRTGAVRDALDAEAYLAASSHHESLRAPPNRSGSTNAVAEKVPVQITPLLLLEPPAERDGSEGTLFFATQQGLSETRTTMKLSNPTESAGSVFFKVKTTAVEACTVTPNKLTLRPGQMQELSIAIHLEKLLQGAGATDQAEPPKFLVEAVAEDGSSRIEVYKFMSVIRKEIATELP